MNFLVTAVWDQKGDRRPRVDCWHIGTANTATVLERTTEVQAEVTRLLERLTRGFEGVRIKSVSVTKI